MAQQDEARPKPFKRAAHGPDPAAHASVLVEWFGAGTALEMARYYSNGGRASAYWSEVLASLTARFSQ
ncbi:MAG: hypothetical protein ABSA52_19150 [Candidatus Binatia bacterium]|jgi:hypothetical protein